MAIEKYNEALLETARVKAAQEKLVAIQSKIIDAEIEGSKARLSFQEKLAAATEKARSGDEAAIAIRDQLLKIQNAINTAEQKGFDATSQSIKQLKDQETVLLNIIRNGEQYKKTVTDMGIVTGKP